MESKLVKLYRYFKILISLFCPVITSSRITVDGNDAGDICIKCMISSASDSLGCVVLLHLVNDLSNITVREVNKRVQQPYCIHVGRRENRFLVAVFEWKNDGFISFQPATVIEIIIQPSKCS